MFSMNNNKKKKTVLRGVADRDLGRRSRRGGRFMAVPSTLRCSTRHFPVSPLGPASSAARGCPLFLGWNTREWCSVSAIDGVQGMKKKIGEGDEGDDDDEREREGG